MLYILIERAVSWIVGSQIWKSRGGTATATATATKHIIGHIGDASHRLIACPILRPC